MNRPPGGDWFGRVDMPRLVRKGAGDDEDPKEPKPKDAGDKPEPILYNVADACFMLGKISKPMLYRLVHNKELIPVKIGSRSLFTLEELQRYVRERQQDELAG
jgi:excisionase family DNA binding protein